MVGTAPAQGREEPLTGRAALDGCLGISDPAAGVCEHAPAEPSQEQTPACAGADSTAPRALDLTVGVTGA